MTDDCGWRVKRQPIIGLYRLGEQRARRAARFKPVEPDVKARLIGVISPATDDDQVRPRTFEVDMRARCRAGDPLTVASSRCDAAIKRNSKFQCDQRAPRLLLHEPTRQASFCRFSVSCELGGYASSVKTRRALAVGARIRIAQSDHDMSNARTGNQVCAGWPAYAVVRARL